MNEMKNRAYTFGYVLAGCFTLITGIALMLHPQNMQWIMGQYVEAMLYLAGVLLGTKALDKIGTRIAGAFAERKKAPPVEGG